MNGRQEAEAKVRQNLRELIYDYPHLQDYLDYLSGNSYLTRKEYLQNVYKFLKFIDVETNINYRSFRDIKKVSLKILMKFIKNDRMRYFSLKNFYHFLLVSGYVDYNLCDKMDAPKDRKEHKVVSLTVEEIEIIKNNIINGVGDERQRSRNKLFKKRDYAIVMLALTTGLRVGSIREIDLDDLDFEKGELTITEKGNKTRTIYLTESMVKIISDYLPDREKILYNIKDKDGINALFVSRRKNRISYLSINELLKKYTYNIDKKITPHKLRSTCATLLYENTQDVMVVKDTLGHQDVKTTMRYIGEAEKRLRKSSNVMGNLLLNEEK